jgi:hypothetical protein
VEASKLGIGQGAFVIKLKVFWARYRRVIFKLMRDSVAPLLAALIWGVYVAINKGSNVDGLNGGSLAFFLILSLQNLIQRAAKVVYDEEHGEKVLSRFDILEQGFGNLQQGLIELRAQNPIRQPEAAPPAEPEPPAPEPLPTLPPVHLPEALPEPKPSLSPYRAYRYWRNQWPSSGRMRLYLDEAARAVEDGHYLAGVLVAAVGFENTARDIARQFDIPDRKFGLGAILRELSSRTAGTSIKLLMTLNRIRNDLVHGERTTADITRAEALELIQYFSDGAMVLESIRK